MADRAWLETALPPVFGKEIRNGPLMADTSGAGIGHFYFNNPPPLEKGGWGDLRLEICWSL